MIRAYVAVVDSDSPIPDLLQVINSSKRETVRFTEHNRQFFISIENTKHSFKVVGNIRTVDKRNVSSGLVRIGFATPNIDIVILGDIICNTRDIENFMYTVENVKDIKLPPPKCSDIKHAKKLRCICLDPDFSSGKYPVCNRSYCPFSVIGEDLCAFCCYLVLERYKFEVENACNIFKSWKTTCENTYFDMPTLSMTVKSYPYLRKLTARGNTVEILESFGSLPCLTELELTHNRLGQATNWNWMTSPFIRENLQDLFLDFNELSTVPEPIAGLRNLKRIILNYNSLTELPAAWGHLKNLRSLHIMDNKLAIFPTWVYRKERFTYLNILGNDELAKHRLENMRSRLNPNDFSTVPVPSLLETVAKCIIMERLPFWEFNLPSRLPEYLERAYFCRCGSVAFPDTNGLVLQCRIKTMAIAEHYMGDDSIPIAIRCCSYSCYKIIETYLQ